MPDDDYIIVFTTCNSAEIASLISDMLVSQKLAACVNIVKGVESVYQWQGKIERDNEILLIIKTRQALFSQLEHMIQELHDYELPEIIAVPVKIGEKNYLNWIHSATLTTEL
ncbi:MAG: divalent-cation tolerance protein CutA [Gammaproteobacteria bacterium]|nr:divalent-cation tolerance protein CutA [Gammaproteobacteria bacterium]MCW8986372.1 divalent-cation tolerance protein CutA [Gammaproteobacteria bacterium]MCW9031282.1 divalent-cation tolerance protein CutA [Gammaproteobacteria bacterium]